MFIWTMLLCSFRCLDYHQLYRRCYTFHIPLRSPFPFLWSPCKRLDIDFLPFFFLCFED
jgi:hypothetical protein